MSIYLVNDETINNIVYTLGHATFQTHLDTGFAPPPKELQVSTFTEAKELAQKLADLNRKSFLARYPDETVDNDWHQFSTGRLLSPVQFFKSLQCLAYQCTSTNNDPLYKTIVEYTKEQAIAIVEATEKYKNARWG